MKLALRVPLVVIWLTVYRQLHFVYGLAVFDLLVLRIGLWHRDELLHAHINQVNLE